MNESLDYQRVKQLPKAELHCHLDGSVRAATIVDLAAESGIVLPAPDAVALEAYMRADGDGSLERYLSRFALTLSVLQTDAALERVAYELVSDVADDGVRYLETRFAPILNTRGGLEPGGAVEAVLRGLARGERDRGVVSRLILCALRDHTPAASLDAACLAVEYQKQGVVGFDLAGPEADHPASAHRLAFAYARDHGLACTCHAGEAAGAESVSDAVYECGALRIGHGTRLIEDWSLLDILNLHRTAIEVCLTSNVQTGAASSVAAHPARSFIDEGLNVVLNTDNRLVSGVTLTGEYLRAHEELGLTFDDLVRVALNGFESAFVDAETRQRLIADATRDIERLRAAELPAR